MRFPWWGREIGEPKARRSSIGTQPRKTNRGWERPPQAPSAVDRGIDRTIRGKKDMSEAEEQGRPHTCDIVMKGGITSGIVYPLAICKLSEAFQFKNIAGTSAGAIAAAATAAAELGRQNGRGGFGRLRRLPTELGSKKVSGSARSTLFWLFQPNRETCEIFEVLVAGLGAEHRWLSILATAIWCFPMAALLGLLPGMTLAMVAIHASAGLVALACWVLATLAVPVGLFCSLLADLLVRAHSSIPGNFYGLCSGHSPIQEGQPLALTDWLAVLLDELAGKSPEDGPLTFGDLWGSSAGADKSVDDRNINLEMMTTNLTLGRPEHLPLDREIYSFDPAEFERLFPKPVVQWMQDHPREPKTSKNSKELSGLCRMPAEKDLPVVVAARMSLSFPLLIGAVPLYAIDHVAKDEKEKVKKCWFSDGGIVSNFPVYFFDRPLPSWPTFAINLRPDPRAAQPSTNECENVWMPSTNNAGIAARWSPMKHESGLPAIGSFLGLILQCMQNWSDDSYISTPGFRDRIVHVYLWGAEGGLNLNMSPPRIEALSSRGECAAELLVKRFGPTAARDVKLGWDHHRWIRYRVLMDLLEQLLFDLREGYRPEIDGMRGYRDLVKRGNHEPPSGYRWQSGNQQRFADRSMEALMKLVEEWEQSGQSFRTRAPRSRSVLRIVPRI